MEIRRNRHCMTEMLIWKRYTSNDRTSTFKMHVRPIEEINSKQVSALKTFVSVLKKNIKNIGDYISALVQKGHIKNGNYTKNADVVWGNTNGNS